MTVEKREYANISSINGQSVRFLVYPSQKTQSNQHYQVDLALFNGKSSRIILSDGNGRLLLEDVEAPQQTYVIKNLSAGTYFFEINDGFFYQIKELRISA
ncbi:MAG: hypothetical protein AAFY71_08815 [Bacteroidota bacterium]